MWHGLGWVQLKILVVLTIKTGGGDWPTTTYFFYFLSGVRPNTNYFVIFQPGSGQILSNYVILNFQKPSL